MSERLDELDRSIVLEFQRDGRVSNREVARRLGISEGTVRARVRKLEAERLLRFVAVSDPLKRGLGCIAWVCLHVEHGSANRVADELRLLPELPFVALTLGRFNVVALAIVRDRDTLAELLTERIIQLPGVQRTETLETLEVFKHDHRWVRAPEATSPL